MLQPTTLCLLHNMLVLLLGHILCHIAILCNSASITMGINFINYVDSAITYGKPFKKVTRVHFITFRVP